MGVNWSAGLIRWRPHRSSDGTVYNLDHLHPFQFVVAFETYKGMPARNVVVRVGFSMHVFTCAVSNVETQEEIYQDDREQRAFNLERYKLSQDLRRILGEIEKRPCFHAGNRNFVTVQRKGLPAGREYRIFFSVRRMTGSVVELIVQSAYLARTEHSIRKKAAKRIGFRVIVAETLRGKCA